MVVITVEFVNDKPISIIDSAIVCEDDSVVVNVQANDSDPADGNILYTYIITAPVNGVSIVLDGDSIQYNPALNFFGWDSLTYMVCDSTPGSACNPDSIRCDTAIVYFEVLSVSDGPPVTTPDTVAVCEDDSITVDVKANDFDPDELPLFPITIITPPDSGTAVVVGTDSIKYVPNPNFFGNDTIFYEVRDSAVPSPCDPLFVSLYDTGMVVITVLPVNEQPIAIADTFVICEDSVSVVDVQANDTDVDGDTLTTTILSGPDSGIAVLLANDSIFYDPDSNFTGYDTIIYVICDSSTLADTSLCNNVTVLCDTTLLIINVGGGPTEDKPDVTLSTPTDLNNVSSFMNIRVTPSSSAVGGTKLRWS